MDVLVTDGFDKTSLAVVRAIQPVVDDIGTTVRFPFSLAAMSRHTARDHRLSGADADEYASELAGTVERYGYDIVVPVGGRTTEIVSEHRDEIPVPLDPVLPPQSSFRRVTDKHELTSMAEDLDIPTPASERIATAGDIPRAVDTVGPSGVFKTGKETEPRFLRYVDSPGALRRAYRNYRPVHDSDPLYQEYLHGQGRGFFGMYIDGECQGQYAHRRIRESPPSGGKSACAESLRDPELSEYADRLLPELDWSGVVMLEFKDDADGNAHLLECNPKLWGSMDLGVASGMNFPRALVEYLATGRRPSFEFTPTQFHWPLSGDLAHALREPASAPDVAADLLSPATESNIRMSDPLPHLSELARGALSSVYTADGPVG
jgi:predicted ATP-grasp superfamily ATP-dependent carboligase